MCVCVCVCVCDFFFFFFFLLFVCFWDCFVVFMGLCVCVVVAGGGGGIVCCCFSLSVGQRKKTQCSGFKLGYLLYANPVPSTLIADDLAPALPRLVLLFRQCSVFDCHSSWNRF